MGFINAIEYCPVLPALIHLFSRNLLIILVKSIADVHTQTILTHREPALNENLQFTAKEFNLNSATFWHRLTPD